MYRGYVGDFMCVVQLIVAGTSRGFFPATYKAFEYPSGDYYSNNGLLMCRKVWSRNQGFLTCADATACVKSHPELPYLVGGISVVKKTPLVPDFIEFEQIAIDRLKAA